MADTQARLRDFALSLSGAWEDLPWGERVTKLDKKVFVFFGHDDGTGPPTRRGRSGAGPHRAPADASLSSQAVVSSAETARLLAHGSGSAGHVRELSSL